MSQTTNPIDELTAQVTTLQTRRDALRRELGETQTDFWQKQEQAKLGLLAVAEVEAPRAAVSNLEELLSQIETDLFNAQTALSEETAVQAEAEFWAALRDLAEQAQAKGAEFDAIRNRVATVLLEGLGEMDAAKSEWDAVRLQFRDKAMRRISKLPEIPGKVGRYQSDIEHSKQLLSELQKHGVGDVRNVRDVLPAESTYGMVPTEYPYGPLDSQEAALLYSVWMLFNEGTFRKYLK